MKSQLHDENRWQSKRVGFTICFHALRLLASSFQRREEDGERVSVARSLCAIFIVHSRVDSSDDGGHAAAACRTHYMPSPIHVNCSKHKQHNNKTSTGHCNVVYGNLLAVPMVARYTSTSRLPVQQVKEWLVLGVVYPDSVPRAIVTTDAGTATQRLKIPFTLAVVRAPRVVGNYKYTNSILAAYGTMDRPLIVWVEATSSPAVIGIGIDGTQ
eukprot:scaffold135641_cov68-Attheya_sp.AAC.2